MLVLSRKREESVVVGGSSASAQMVKVTVLEIRGGQVTLGFEGNKDVPVYREEVWERIQASQPRDPPLGDLHGTGSRNGNGTAAVLSGTGNGRSL